LVGAAGLTLTEMPRHADRSFCCGAGGARMWMEEHIGKRVNMARTEEALATEAKQIATGCPFCRTMLTDGLTEKQSEGIGEDVQVLDVSQMLLNSVKRGDPHTNGKANGSAPKPSESEPVEKPGATSGSEPVEKPAES
ncbi:MAG: hypothetical protein QOC83_4228, partial [Pseudonocardiales bacterium]|nr:hypothetical protein [Pseudonocardiales bacterium]